MIYKLLMAVFSQNTDKLDRQVEKYERKLEKFTDRIAQDQVSVVSAYKSIANDCIIF